MGMRIFVLAGFTLLAQAPGKLNVARQVVEVEGVETLLENFVIDSALTAAAPSCLMPTLEQWAAAARDPLFVPGEQAEAVQVSQTVHGCLNHTVMTLEPKLVGPGTLIHLGAKDAVQRRLVPVVKAQAAHRCVETLPGTVQDYYVQASKLNVRATRAADSNLVATLPIGMRISGCLAPPGEAGWIYVHAQSKTPTCNRARSIEGWARIELLDAAPPNGTALHQKGVAALAAGDTNTALPLLERAAALMGTDETLADLQRAYAAAELTDKADTLRTRLAALSSAAEPKAFPVFTTLVERSATACGWVRKSGSVTQVLAELTTPCSTLLHVTIDRKATSALITFGTPSAPQIIQVALPDLVQSETSGSPRLLPPFSPKLEEVWFATHFTEKEQQPMLFTSFKFKPPKKDNACQSDCHGLRMYQLRDNRWAQVAQVHETSEDSETDTPTGTLAHEYFARTWLYEGLAPLNEQEAPQFRLIARSACSGPAVPPAKTVGPDAPEQQLWCGRTSSHKICTCLEYDEECSECYGFFTGKGASIEGQVAHPFDVRDFIGSGPCAAYTGYQFQGPYFLRCTKLPQRIWDLNTSKVIKESRKQPLSLWPYDLCTAARPVKPPGYH